MSDYLRDRNAGRLPVLALLALLSNAANAQYTPQVKVTGERFNGYSGCQGPLGSCDSISFGTSSSPNDFGYGSYTRTTPPSQVNSPSDDSRTSPVGCHPVIYATGEKIQDETDFTDFSLDGLSLARTYRSNGQDSTNSSLFGPNWFASLQFRKMVFSSSCRGYSDWLFLGCVPDWVQVSTLDGAVHSYSLYNLPMFLPPGTVGSGSLGYMVVRSSQQWTLVIDDYQYNYNPQTKNLDSIYQRGALLYSYTYVGNNLVRITSRSGKTVQLTWTSNRVTSIVDPDGKTWTYQYDGFGNLTAVLPPSGAGVRQYHYESPVNAALLTGITVDGVRSTRYSYDANKRVVHSGFENGEAFDDLSYTATSTTVNNENGQPITYNFQLVNSYKRLVSVNRTGTASCAATASSQGYDAAGNLAYTVDWNGVRTEYNYNADGQLIEQRDAVSTPAARKTVFAWANTKLANSTFVNGASQEYLAIGQGYNYEGAGTGLIASRRLTDRRTSATRDVSYSYTFYPQGGVASKTTSAVIPGGTANTVESYDMSGNLIAATDALGHQSLFRNHTGLGQPREMVDANGISTYLTYDPKGNVLSSTTVLPNGNRELQFAYNGASLPTIARDADGHTTNFSYNSAGRLIGSTNAKGEAITFELDAPNRASSIVSARAVPSLNGTTPVGVGAGEFRETTNFDSLGREQFRVHGPRKVTSAGYDGNGNVTFTFDSATHMTAYEYDAANRLVKTTLPDGGVIGRTYDEAGRLATVTDPRKLVTTYTYNAFGELLTLASPDSGTATNQYDIGGRLQQTSLANGKTIFYVRDALGRILQRNSGASTERFTYDEGAYGIGRLSRINDLTGETVYSYTAAGELARQVNNIYGNVLSTTWNYDSAGKLMGMVYPTGLALTYSYDAYGRLAAVKTASVLKNP